MKRKSIYTLVTVLAIGIILFMIASTPRRNTPLTNQPQLNQQRLNYEQNLLRSNQRIASPRPSIIPQKISLVDRQKTDKVYKQLNKIKDLSQVGVIVTGNTALVGYRISKLDKNVILTKSMIAKRVKQTDPSIKNVVVSESANILARINKLTTAITQNRPANEISNEINQLLKGITPTVT